MFGNLKNNNFNNIQVRINQSEYYDVYLSSDINFCESLLHNNNVGKINDDCLISYIDTYEKLCLGEDYVVSNPNYQYGNGKIAEGYTLNNVAFCGVDNSLVDCQVDRLSNKEINDIFKSTKLSLDNSEYENLRLHFIKSNTKLFDYPISYTEDNVIRCNGGFMQGFFQTECNKYRVLPSNIENVWTFEFTLMKHEHEKESEKTLNDKHPNNKGIFFYIGTRAENKWALKYNDKLFECSKGIEDSDYLYDEDYNRNYEKPNKHDLNYFVHDTDTPYVIDGYLTDLGNGEDNKKLSFILDDYMDLSDYECCGNVCISDKEECNNCCEPKLINWIYDYWYFDGSNSKKCSMESCYIDLQCPRETSNIVIKHGSCENCNEKEKNCGDYLKDNSKLDSSIKSDWILEDAFDEKGFGGDIFLIDPLYYEKELDLSQIIYNTDSNARFDLNIDFVSFKTDNKFLMFDRTCNGLVAKDYEDNIDYYISYINYHYDSNLFLLMNRTCNGKTVKDIDTIKRENLKEYDIEKDLYQNAFGLRITDDGRIGYRYIVIDCETNHYKVEEFYSKEGIVKEEEWFTIACKIIKIFGKMQLYIYYNGKLVLVSKYLPILKLRELNDIYEKQESVPYNISLCGGSQGLAEVIFPQEPMYRYNEVLPIEENFGGTFIGYFKSFRFHDCNVEQYVLERNAKIDIENMLKK